MESQEGHEDGLQGSAEKDSRGEIGKSEDGK